MLVPDKDIVSAIGASLDIVLQEGLSLDELKKMIACYVNPLINNDFNKLISILYRMDINEAKLRQLLHDNPTEDAGIIIADLIIERQIEKVKSKNENREDNIISGDNINENEKW